jgi:hypothetical protein
MDFIIIIHFYNDFSTPWAVRIWSREMGIARIPSGLIRESQSRRWMPIARACMGEGGRPWEAAREQMGRDRRFTGSRQGKGHGRPRKGADGAVRGRKLMARYDTGTSPEAASAAWGHRRPMDGVAQSFPIKNNDIREFSINSLHSRISYFAPEMIKHSGPGVLPTCIRG